jgi:hypothetical protein
VEQWLTASVSRDMLSALKRLHQLQQYINILYLCNAIAVQLSGAVGSKHRSARVWAHGVMQGA